MALLPRNIPSLPGSTRTATGEVKTASSAKWSSTPSTSWSFHAVNQASTNACACFGSMAPIMIRVTVSVHGRRVRGSTGEIATVARCDDDTVTSQPSPRADAASGFDDVLAANAEYARTFADPHLE